MKFLWLGLSLVFLIIGVCLYMQTTRCSAAVMGTFVGIQVLKSTGMKDYFPVFRYVYDGCEYEVRSLQSFSRRFLEKTFEPGKEYTIYIDPKKPRNAAVRNKPQTADILVLLMGAGCFILFLAG